MKNQSKDTDGVLAKVPPKVKSVVKESPRTPTLSIDGKSEEVECEDLVKITIGDDSEKFFSGGIPVTSTRKGGADRVP